MIKIKFSLATLMLAVLFIGAVCATLHYAHRASQVRAEFATQMAEMQSAKTRQLQAMDEVYLRKMAQASQEMHKGWDFQTRTTIFVIDSLRSDVPAVRQWAAQLLGEMYPDAVVAAALWKGLSEDPDAEIRRAAAASLKKVEELVSALKGNAVKQFRRLCFGYDF